MLITFIRFLHSIGFTCSFYFKLKCFLNQPFFIIISDTQIFRYYTINMKIVRSLFLLLNTFFIKYIVIL